MKYLSVCSGIEAATVAWHDLGWEPVGFSEIEKFPSQVLAHHYPNVTNFGDMTKYKEWKINEPVDLLVGGTPCQSFSVAGLRKGMDDPRGNLALVYCGILDHFRPKWFVWENVPGVLSSSGGRDFGSFLGAVAELGYGFSYRVLDAQYFGVAQRRRRVFVVGHLGDWRPAAAVLFERSSLRRDTAPSAPPREEIAKCLTRGVGQRYDPETESLIPSYGIPGNWIGRKPENGGNAVEPMHDVSPCLTKTDRHGVAQAVSYGFEPGIAKREGSPSRFSLEVSPTLRAQMGDNQAAVSYGFTQCDAARDIGIEVSPTLRSGGDGGYPNHSVAQAGDTYNGTIQGDVAATMTADMADPTHSGPKVMQNFRVRRLTPVECERLQGFPDNYTNIREKCPDSPRYKALGNSMAVPVMQWIGDGIDLIDKL